MLIFVDVWQPGWSKPTAIAPAGLLDMDRLKLQENGQSAEVHKLCCSYEQTQPFWEWIYYTCTDT